MLVNIKANQREYLPVVYGLPAFSICGFLFCGAQFSPHFPYRAQLLTLNVRSRTP
jgi:hypothetical protein